MRLFLSDFASTGATLDLEPGHPRLIASARPASLWQPPHFGIGALSETMPSRLRSLHKSAGTGRRKYSTFCRTCSGEMAPGMTEATIGCASGNCRAAAAIGVLCFLQVA